MHRLLIGMIVLTPVFAQADCEYFGPKHDRFVSRQTRAVGGEGATGHRQRMSEITSAVAALLPKVPAGSRTASEQKETTIDYYLFGAMQNAGVAPAPPTTDYEFIRRVTLDLTGRIPTPDRVASFIADNSSDKRAKLVDELIAKPEWIDKWTMYFGDLYQNNSQNSQIRRYPEGVKAFNDYLRASLSANKPYNQIATDLITATGSDSYTDGTLNLIVGGIVTGGPAQDDYDQMTANISSMFLGLAHVNCLLCHNGRGHLDTLSLWGSQQTRTSAWQLSSYFSHTSARQTPVSSSSPTPYYWNVLDSGRTDYQLNTTTGNRPPRQPVGTAKTMAPAYFFTGDTPKAGENYRAALARALTTDFQFSRAAVNYLW